MSKTTLFVPARPTPARWSSAREASHAREFSAAAWRRQHAAGFAEAIATPVLLALAVLPVLGVAYWGAIAGTADWTAWMLERSHDTLWVPRWILPAAVAVIVAYVMLRAAANTQITRLRNRFAKSATRAAAPTRVQQLLELAALTERS